MDKTSSEDHPADIGRTILITLVAIVLVSSLGYSIYLTIRGSHTVTTTDFHNTTITESITLTQTLTTTHTHTLTVTHTTTSTVESTTTVTTIPPISQFPIIMNGRTNVSYPSDYAELASYTLQLINEDRGKFGLSPVTLSPIPSAQQHANSMLYFGYFSHWDTQGYKPYMRYTILGGTGAVAENIAFYSYSRPHFVGDNVKQDLKDAQWNMMYNDKECCDDGHRKNILNPYHNRVSIGIAYNSTHLYYAQNFENYYLLLDEPIYSDGELLFAGTSLKQMTPNDISIYVYYDGLPIPLSTSTLGRIPYSGAYDSGKLIGGVLPPCSLPRGGCPYYRDIITGYASVWQVTSNTINIHFTLRPFIKEHGSGVYTIHLLDPEKEPLEEYASISIFLG